MVGGPKEKGIFSSGPYKLISLSCSLYTCDPMWGIQINGLIHIMFFSATKTNLNKVIYFSKRSYL